VEVFDFHTRRAGIREQLAGRTVVELGPGDSLATALIAAAHGARAIIVDTGSWARKDLDNYHSLQRHLQSLGIPGPDISHCRTIEDMLETCDAIYLTEGLASLKSLPAETIDLVYSHAVLEHVRNADFATTMAECRRILRPGGSFSHQVDLKDHLGGALNNLRFSERVWESDLFSKSGFYTNRIRFSRMLRLFEDAGFKIELLEKQNWQQLPTARSKLDPEFRSLPDDELLVSGFTVLMR
jgi:predicted SAM-dependent methyltransferase